MTEECSCEDNRIALIKNIQEFEKQSYDEPDREHNLHVNFPDGDRFRICISRRSKYLECEKCENSISMAYINAGECVAKMVQHSHAWHSGVKQ